MYLCIYIYVRMKRVIEKNEMKVKDPINQKQKVRKKC